MNRHFVNIKVDREERPDLDAIYMQAVVAMTGQGGWPMTVFLTPDGRPFYGGTYFPPVPRYGMPSFIQLMQGIVNAWETKREDVLASAGDYRTFAANGRSHRPGRCAHPRHVWQSHLCRPGQSRRLTTSGAALAARPNFPPSMTLEYLLRMHLARDDARALQMAEKTLQTMAYGGTV
jgi:uncharacterized protein